MRHAFGVARATICEMVTAIEKLGWVTRRVCGVDRRTRVIRLTALGRALFNRAYERWLYSGVVPVSVDAIMSSFDVERDPTGERFVFGAFLSRLRRCLGDHGMHDLYRDDPMDHIGHLTLPGHGSDGVPFVELT